MHEFLLTFVVAHPFEVYFVIVLLALAEGPYLSLILGGLLSAGYFSFIPLYFSLMFGDLLGDIVWYYLGFQYGHRFVNRFGKYFDITEKHIEKVKEKFHQHKNPILFLSKITNGFGFAIVVLFTAGLTRIPFPRYMSLNVLGQTIWSGLLIGVGYFFGNLYVRISTITGKLLLISVAIIIIILIARFVRNYRKRVDN